MMSARDLIALACTQAWQLVVLILIVWAVTRWVAKDRPHLAHALWLVVLLKCVTPPIWSSPTGVFSWLQWQSQAVESSTPEASGAKLAGPEPSVAAEPPQRAATEMDAQASVDHHAWSTFSSSPPDVPSRFDCWSLLLAIWCGGAGLLFTSTTVRCGRFRIHLSRHPTGTNPEITACIKRLSRRLGVRRQVHAAVTESRIGPAVIGLLRPTVLLPSVIIEGKSAAELEPLVAHELVHVRRGDLFWAIVQTMATSLWWFHPLVWIASRMITREAERSCDEEVVAELGCEPGVYARGLLDVLERKHRLRSAPVFPGVRAVDITSSRLERIMRLGQGSHRRTPWWCWLLVAVVAAIALPGARLTSAGEGEPAVAAGDYPPAPPLAEPPKAAGAPHPEMIVIDDLLQRVVTETRLEGEDAASALAAILAPSTPAGLIPGEAKRSVEISVPAGGQVRKITLGGSNPRIQIVDNALYIFDSSERRRQVHEAIGRLRHYGFQRLMIQAHIVSASPAELEALESGASASIGDSALSYVQDAELSRLLEAAQANPRIHVLQSSRITVFNGQQGTISGMAELAGDVQAAPRVMHQELQMRLRPVLDEDERVRLVYELTLEDVSSAKATAIPQEAETASPRIGKPKVPSMKMSSTLNIPLGETVVIGGLTHQSAGNETATMVMITCKKAGLVSAASAADPPPSAPDESSVHNRLPMPSAKEKPRSADAEAAHPNGPQELDAQERNATAKVGALVPIRMTGELAGEYLRLTAPLRGKEGPARGYQDPPRYEIQRSAYCARDFHDGRFRIELSERVEVEGKPDRLVTLTATVDPTMMESTVIPSNTSLYSTPADKKKGVQPTLTQEDKRGHYWELSSLAGVEIRTWTLAEEIGDSD